MNASTKRVDGIRRGDHVVESDGYVLKVDRVEKLSASRYRLHLLGAMGKVETSPLYAHTMIRMAQGGSDA